MMATYFQGGDNNLQTLFLMNPNYITPPPYSEPHLNDMPHHQHQLIGIPLSGTHPSNDLGRTSSDHQHNQFPPSMLWSPTRSNSINDFSGQMDFRQPMSSVQSGLSLSLTPGQQQNQSHNHGGGSGEDMRMSVTVAGGPGTYNGPIAGSKYLKATQELLEEVVNVKASGSSNKGDELSDEVHKHKAKAAVKNDDDDDGAAGYGGQGGSGGDSGSGSKKGVELTTAQKHELQMKKAKLLNMLDEVEQRYRQYQTQMQVVVSSFEQTAGLGSAKSYTSLALKTISKQFKCLKDTIASQIKATSKSLGEEDNDIGGVKLERTRLRFIDQQLRQQRALQQLGMVQNNAWRPQRGLPERAVSVLRAWLFEHFLHPYPKDSDKHMLAKQTGLTRSQVSNWFINARVRLWKPMVEEMYVEEMKSQEQNGVTSEENTKTATNTTDNGGFGSSSSKNEHHFTTNKTSIMGQQHEDVGFNMIQTNQNNHIQQQTNDMISSLSTMSTTTTSSQGFTLIGSSLDMESLMARSPKKQRSNSDMNSPSSILSMDMEMKPINQRHNSSFMTSHGSEAGGVGFNPYIVDNDIGRFTPNQINQSYNGNAVSLTLGLPHCENLSLSENHQQNYFQNQGMQLGRRVEIGQGEGEFCGVSMGQSSLPSNGYDTIDMQSRKRFAAQILHDFVA